jgi:tetratricopeptide (TPR) repeat protein
LPDWLIAILLVAATILAWQPVWRAGFIWDDDAYLTRQGLRSLHGLGLIWSHWGATLQYYPLTYSAFWVEHRLWGEASAPYHWVNILLHASSALLVAAILKRLEVPGAWMAAALFALHPVQVESVAWVSELKNTLSGLFYLGAMLAYLKFQSSNHKSFYSLSLLLFVLGLLTKTVVATLPGALLVLIWWKRGSLGWRRDVLPLVPFFGAGLGAGLVTAWAERELVGARGSQYDFTFLERCLIAGRDVWFYLGKLCWPMDLVFIYPRWHVSQGALWQYAFPLGVLGVVAVLAWRRWRGPLAALLFFVGTLFPALGFFNVYPFRYSFVADHFQYLACLGPLTLAASALCAAKSFLKPILCGALLLTLGTLTWRQCAMYADEPTLWKTTLAREPDCWMARCNLGVFIHKNGQFDEAIRQFSEAIRLKPDLAEAHNDLGAALRSEGRADESMSQFQQALRLNPDYPEAHYNLALALDDKGQSAEAISQCLQAIQRKPDYFEALNKAGTILDRVGRFDDAILQYREAIRLRPEDAEAHYNLGGSLLRKGRSNEALGEWREAIRLNPNYAEAHSNLALLFAGIGRRDEATTEYQTAIRLRPDSAGCHFDYGLFLRNTGRIHEAISQFQEAARLKPGAETSSILGTLLAKAGRLDQAVLQLQDAIRLHPDYADAHNNLGIVLSQQGKFGEAAAHFREAIRLDPNDASLFCNLAHALSLQGLRAEAAEQYRMALRINPNLPQAQNALRSLEQGK